MSDQDGSDLREFERASSFVSGTIHKLNSDEQSSNEALVLNISAGGMMLLTAFPLKKQDVFGISIAIKDEKIVYVDVRVCWKFGDMIGVKFLDLADSDKTLIEGVVNSGEVLGEL